MYNFQVCLQVAWCNMAVHGLDTTAVKQRNKEMIRDARLHAIDKLSKHENLNPIFVPILTFIIDSVTFLVSLR